MCFLITFNITPFYSIIFFFIYFNRVFIFVLKMFLICRLAQCVRVMMATAIFLSYCLQFYVPMNIIWPIIKKRLHTDQAQFYGEYATRTGLVILTFALAAAIPNLGAVISLVGAFSSSALALIFPPIIDTVVFWEDCIGKKKWILVKNIFIVLIGLAGFTFGTYASLMNIWNGQTASS